MKKILSLLAATTFVVSATVSSVSCGSVKENTYIENFEFINPEVIVAYTNNIPEGNIIKRIKVTASNSTQDLKVAPFDIYSANVRKGILTIRLTYDMVEGQGVSISYKTDSGAWYKSERLTYEPAGNNQNAAVKILIASILKDDASTFEVDFISPLKQNITPEDIEIFDLTHPFSTNPNMTFSDKPGYSGKKGDSGVEFSIDKIHAHKIGQNDNVWIIINGLCTNDYGNRPRPDTMGITNNLDSIKK